jgi:hypothetical protein
MHLLRALASFEDEAARERAAVRDYLIAFGDRPQAGASEPGRSSSIR